MGSHNTPYYTRSLDSQTILVDAMMTVPYPVWDTYVTNIDNPDDVVHPITNLVRFGETSTATHHTYVRHHFSDLDLVLTDGNKLKVNCLLCISSSKRMLAHPFAWSETIKNT